ncbi:thioredoxin family protein [Salmonella enterica]
MAFTIDLGTKAPFFSLSSSEGEIFSLDDFSQDRNLVVAFICNHCPMVKGSVTRILKLVNKYPNVEFVAINSNHLSHYPSDSFIHMHWFAEAWGIKFPYLYDKTQEIAKAYGAIRTPHFFVFNTNRELVYRGGLDDSPRDETLVTKIYLDAALTALEANKCIEIPETMPKGCTIKWEGKDEHWLPEEYCDI